MNYSSMNILFKHLKKRNNRFGWMLYWDEIMKFSSAHMKPVLSDKVDLNRNESSPLFYAASQAQIYVPQFGKQCKRCIREYPQVDRQGLAIEKTPREKSSVHPLNKKREDDAEEAAWAQVHGKYNFMLKPSYLSWKEFLAEQTRYSIRWKLLSTKSQVMSLSINEHYCDRKNGHLPASETKDDVSVAENLHVICDCSRHNTMNDVLAALCHHWHSKEQNSAIRVIDDRGNISEMILATTKGQSSIFFLGKGNFAEKDVVTDRYVIIPSISLATLTRIILESVIVLLNDKTFGFPNYKLCQKAHMSDIHRMWGTLRAAACLREEPLPIAENQIS